MKHAFQPWVGDHLVLDTAAMSVEDAINRAAEYVLGHRSRLPG
jgi:hypothetical protein